MQSVRSRSQTGGKWSVALAVSALTWLLLACSGGERRNAALTPAARAPSQITRGPGRTPPAGSVEQTGAQPYIARVETATTQGNAASDGNGWGGNISRIVRASNGDIYTTVVGDGPQDYYHRPWYIVKRSAATGQWTTYTAPGSAGNNVFNPPNILRGPNDELYVLSWPNGVPYFWSSVSNTDTPLPGSWYVNPTIATGTLESTYGAAGIDAAGDIAMSQSSPSCSTCTTPDKPGELNWAYKATTDQQWRTGGFNPDYRYAYMYLFPDSNGRIAMTGTLSALYTELGYTDPPGSTIATRYTWDGVRQFELSTSGQAAPSSFGIRQEQQDESCPTIRAFANDVYVDTQGRTHVLYDLLGPSTNCQYTGRHAVIQNGQVVADVPLQTPGILTEGIPYSNFGRIIQDSTGRFYIFSVFTPPDGGTSCMMYLQRGTDDDTDGTQLEPQLELPLNTSENCATMQNNFIAAPRGGTPLADYVDGMVAANYGQDWVYYRLCLRSCPDADAAPASAAPSSASATQDASPPSAPTQAPSVSSADTTTPTAPAAPSPTTVAQPSAGPAAAGATATIEVEPSSGSHHAGETFTVAVYISGNGGAFSAAQAIVSVTPNLSVLGVTPGDCGFSFTTVPSSSDPSFAGTLPNGPQQNCAVYTLTLQGNAPGQGSVGISQGSVTAAVDGSEMLRAVDDGQFAIQ